VIVYVPVKGGAQAIDHSARLLAARRRGDPATREIGIDQIDGQLRHAVDRVMAEGGLHDRALAALAIKQAAGDLVEAIFLVRAFRTTLPRLGAACPIDTAGMRVARRISAAFKDLPGGQVLGASPDYTQRLLEFELANPGSMPLAPHADAHVAVSPPMSVMDLLESEGLVEPAGATDASMPVPDLTATPLELPAARPLRLQALARGDEGFLLGLAYSTQRGFGGNHPFAAEIRHGAVDIAFVPDELGVPVVVGTVTLTECQMINQFQGSREVAPTFTRGYGLAFGHAERKAMAMALVDRALRANELGESPEAPAQSAEFVLMHADNVEASGFVQHLKLPHYVDFQSELELIRRVRTEREAAAASPTPGEADAHVADEVQGHA